MSEVYGYVRVSSRDQNEDRQMIAMEEMHVPRDHIFLDKQSGKNFDRPQYLKLFRKLKKGDLLYIKSIDRLGRDYEEIQNQWRILTREKEIDIVVLDMPLLDTRQDKDLMGTVISDIVLQLLSYVAQTEREFNKQRQAEGIAAAKAEGIAAAKARGVLFGSKTKFDPERFEKARSDYLAGACSSREAGEYCGVSHCSFLKWVKASPEKLERLDERRRAQGRA